MPLLDQVLGAVVANRMGRGGGFGGGLGGGSAGAWEAASAARWPGGVLGSCCAAADAAAA
jgi:hypothetical protein